MPSIGGLALAAILAAPASAAFADPSPSSAVDASQISQPLNPDGSARRAASAADAGQISTAKPNGGAPAQLTAAKPRADAPPALSTVAQSRDATASPIKGHDRCDPANGASANRPECDDILDRKADQFDPPEQATAQTVDPDASASSLVNHIVNGGTGSVVTAPTTP
jgi:hypothetical protein